MSFSFSSRFINDKYFTHIFFDVSMTNILIKKFMSNKYLTHNILFSSFKLFFISSFKLFFVIVLVNIQFFVFGHYCFSLCKFIYLSVTNFAQCILYVLVVKICPFFIYKWQIFTSYFFMYQEQILVLCYFMYQWQIFIPCFFSFYLSTTHIYLMFFYASMTNIYPMIFFSFSYLSVINMCLIFFMYLWKILPLYFLIFCFEENVLIAFH